MVGRDGSAPATPENTRPATMNGELETYAGGCHCGAVRFEFEAEEGFVVRRCNCSICRLTDYLHLIVPASRFRLRSGSQALVEYRFNTGVARHRFCSRCGIKSFYIPRSNPDGYSVNYRCVDGARPDEVEIEEIDGQNWEEGTRHLTQLSKG